jgi:hypothetical protein
MGKKPRRRTYRRPSPQQRTEDTARDEQRLTAAAQALLSATGAEALPEELQRREWLLSEADRAAQFDPSPASLSRYRFARSQFDVARAALVLLGGAPR